MNSPSVTQVIVGYDATAPASAALDAAARLLPHAHAWITHLWTPLLADDNLRRRLRTAEPDVDAFLPALERESEWRAARTAETGAVLARAHGWEAETLIHRVMGGEGTELAQLAEKMQPDLVLLGTRSLSGIRAVLGSVSDMVVHYSPKPVLVVPHPLLSTEHHALADGPVIIGWDGSAGARTALHTARQLFPDRRLLFATVVDNGPTAPATAIEAPPHTDAGQPTWLRVPPGHGTPAQAIANGLITCARYHNAAVLLLGSRGRTATTEILLGSTVMATLHHAHRPVLVVPQSHGRS
ncbi:universal stress protein [Actinoplanes xinjiangensis]|uniref:universal stress protein n=1 Tax=Actinoplanes xinjiangensis TaxID=512350 RepID=UPI0034478804